ncbi:MAG: hypothetical protein HHJ11_09535 [Phycicoccus sp.]|nr:hypothetical protein [Phycicoccus sp.]
MPRRRGTPRSRRPPGEGIHTALLSGMLAGRAAVGRTQSPGEAYRRALRRRLGPRLCQTRLAAGALRRPRLLDALVAGASSDRELARAVAALALGGHDTRVWLKVGAATIRQFLGPRVRSSWAV